LIGLNGGLAVSQYDPNLDPTRQPNTPRSEPMYSETIVVRRDSNTGWWVAGILAALVLVAALWLLASREPHDAEAQARLAEAQAAQAQADADSALVQGQIQGQIAGAQQGVEMARADAARAQADAVRAASEARTAEADAAARATAVQAATASAARPVEPAQPSGVAVITSTSPQP